MCTDPAADPRDEILYGVRALRGLCDLVGEAGRAGSRFDLAGPVEMGELLDMLATRLEGAARAVQDYVPRNFVARD